MGKVTSIFDLVADGIKAGRERSQRARDTNYTADTYHGSTHDLTEMDASKTNIEGDWGKGIYSSNNIDDVNENYAGVGPDLTARIEQQRERLQDDILDEIETNGLEPTLQRYSELLNDDASTKFINDIKKYRDNDEGFAKDLADIVARKQIKGSNDGVVYPLKQNTEGFATIGGKDRTIVEGRDYHAEAREEIQRSDYDDEYDYEDAVYQNAHDLMDFDPDTNYRKVMDVIDKHGGGVNVDELSDAFEGDSVDLTKLDEVIRRGDIYSEDELGNMIPNGAVSAEILQNLGFKGVIDNTANTKFGSARDRGRPMDGMDEDTVHYITFEGAENQIRSRNAQFKDPTSKNILAGTAATAITLPAMFGSSETQAGFFSQAVKAAQNLTRKTGNAQGFKNDLTGKGQVKPDELKAMGFDEHFGDRKDITKEEVQQFINDNQINIEEVTKGQVSLPSPYPNHNTSKFGKYTLEGGDNYRELLLQDNSSAGLLDELNSLNNQMGEIKTPLLRKVTSDDALKKRYSDATIFGDMEIDEFVANEIPEYAALLSRRDELVKQKDNLIEPFIESSHFDEPNILAHLRMKDRVDVDGNKTLLIEEAQSDWHQKGNDVGYKISQKQIDKLREKRDLLATKRKELDLEDADYLTNNPNEHRSPDEFMDRSSDNYKALLNAQFNLDTALDIEKVPDAPFKTDDKSSWYNLAMKRGLIEAAEGDYDKLAITTGRQQAERYDLSKTIGSLKYQEDMVEGRPVNILTAYDKQGMRVFNRRIDDPEKELPSIIGKDATKSLLEAEPYTPPQETRSIRSLRGQELNVGGEGMKEFYDRKLPNTLNKLVKQDGVKVGQSGLLKDDNLEIHQVIDDTDERIDWLDVKNQVENYGSENPAVLAKYDAFVSKYKPKTITTDTVHSIDITTEMRDRVKKGLPLFTTAVGVPILNNMFAPKVQAAEYNEAPVIEEQSFGDMVNEYGQINRNLKALDDQRFARAVAEREARRGMSRRERRDNPPSEALRELAMQDMKPSLGSVAQGIVEGNAQGLDYFHPLNLGRMILNPANEGLGRFIAPSIVSTYENAVSPVAKPVLFDERDPKADEKSRSGKNFGNFFSLF